MKKLISAVVVASAIFSTSANADIRLVDQWLVPVESKARCMVVVRSLSELHREIRNPRNTRADVMKFMESESKRINYPVHFYAGFAELLSRADHSFTPERFYNEFVQDCHEHF